MVAAKRISTEGATVISWREKIHDVPPREERRHRVKTPAQCFTKQNPVGFYAIVLTCQETAGAPQARLNLVAYQ